MVPEVPNCQCKKKLFMDAYRAEGNGDLVGGRESKERRERGNEGVKGR